MARFLNWAVVPLALVACIATGVISISTLCLTSSAWLLINLTIYRSNIAKLFGPVFFYELVRTGRKISTRVLRFIYIALLMTLLCFQYLTWKERVESTSLTGTIDSQQLSSFASDFFIIFSTIQLIIVCAITPAYVAGCIADEKERKTLEFMLATDLSSGEIIFGKTVARIVLLLMYILAGLPIFGLLQLFGGIDPELLLASTYISIVSIIGLSAVSIYFSTILRRPRDAIMLSYLFIICYYIITLVVGNYLLYSQESGLYNYSTILGIPSEYFLDLIDHSFRWFGGGNHIYQFTIVLCDASPPLLTNISIASASFTLIRFSLFWIICSITLLLMSTRRLRTSALSVTDRKHSTSSKHNISRERPGIGTNPMLWKELFIESQSNKGWAYRVSGWALVLLNIIPGIMIVLVCFGSFIPLISDLFSLNNDTRSLSLRISDFRSATKVWIQFSTGIISTIAFFVVAIRGASSITSERDRDTWISLISTPIIHTELMISKLIGCFYCMRYLFYLLLALWGFAILTGAIASYSVIPCILYFIGYIIMFSLLGVFFSTTSRTTLRSSLKAFYATFFITGGFWLFLTVSVYVFWPGYLSQRDDDFEPLEIVFTSLTPSYIMWKLPSFDVISGVEIDQARKSIYISYFTPFFVTMLYCIFCYCLYNFSMKYLTKSMNRKIYTDTSRIQSSALS